MNGPLLKGPQPHCVLGGVQSCGSDLTWNAPVPCVNQTCSGGRCTGVCQAGVNGACNGATIEICDTMGNRLVNTCQSSDLCVDGQGCLDCKPGQLSCSSDKKTTRMCTSAGKWQDTGTCASQTCVDGACVGVCMTGSYSQCNGVTVQRCNDQGQWGTENCGSADLCADGKACLVCKPGTSSCWSDKKSTTVCDASGYSWNAGVTCANQTCVDGACAGVPRAAARPGSFPRPSHVRLGNPPENRPPPPRGRWWIRFRTIDE